MALEKTKTTTENDGNVQDYRGRPLGRILVKMGKITRDQVHEALDVQREKGGPIGQIAEAP